jgi:histidine decarboxylase
MSEGQGYQPNQRGNPGIPYGPKGEAWGAQVPPWACVSAPIDDPVDVYPQVPPPDLADGSSTIDYRKFEIPPEGLTEEQREDALNQLRAYIEAQHAHFTGFQVNECLSYRGEAPDAKATDLAWLMNIHANNVGDPFQTGILTLNTKFCERAVVDYFAALWNNDWPHRPDQPGESFPERQWGYVLSMGSTEANLYGLFNARDYLKGRSLIEDPTSEEDKHFYHAEPLPEPDAPNAYRPIIFYSEDTHYSVVKSVRFLELTTFAEEGRTRYPGLCPITKDGSWPDEVPSDVYSNERSGSIDVDALRELVTFFVERGHPPIIVCNYGSTWKGAYDDVAAVNRMLQDLRYRFPWLWDRRVRYDEDDNRLFDRRRGFWLHVDGALGASYMPFVEMAHNKGEKIAVYKNGGLVNEIIGKGPVFDFRNEAVMSICTSLHKWCGAPWPGSVYMTRVGYQLNPPDTAGYIGAADTTLGGSRNAFSSVLWWDYLARNGYKEAVEQVLACENEAAELVNQLKDLEAWLNKEQRKPDGLPIDLWIEHSERSLAVRFRMVNPEITWKYTVDTERLTVPLPEEKEQERTYAHVYVMQHMAIPGWPDPPPLPTDEEGAKRRTVGEALVDEIKTACGPNGENWRDVFPDHDGDLPNPSDPRDRHPAPNEDRGLFVPISGRGLGSFIHPSKRD